MHIKRFVRANSRTLWARPARRGSKAGRQALRNVSARDIATILYPNCGAPRYAPCRTRPTTTLHRGCTLRYLHTRVRAELARAPRPYRAAVLCAGGRRSGTVRGTGTAPQPWRLSLHELSALINVTFLDLVRVATVRACGALSSTSCCSALTVSTRGSMR